MTVTARRITDLADQEHCDFCDQMDDGNFPAAAIRITGDGFLYDKEGPHFCLDCAQGAIKSMSAMLCSIDPSRTEKLVAFFGGKTPEPLPVPKRSKKVLRKK